MIAGQKRVLTSLWAAVAFSNMRGLTVGPQLTLCMTKVWLVLVTAADTGQSLICINQGADQ